VDGRLGVAVRKEKLENEGLDESRLGLVRHYVTEAERPPPRAPLRWWTGGEWIELPAAEPDPVLQARAVETELEPVTTASPPPEPEGPPAATSPPPAPEEAVPAPAQQPHLPIYQWVQAAANDGDGNRPDPAWLRELVLAREARDRTNGRSARR
jgi:hypothetical protein